MHTEVSEGYRLGINKSTIKLTCSRDNLTVKGSSHSIDRKSDTIDSRTAWLPAMSENSRSS